MLHPFSNTSCRRYPSITIWAVYELPICLSEAAASLLLQRCEDWWLFIGSLIPIWQDLSSVSRTQGNWPDSWSVNKEAGGRGKRPRVIYISLEFYKKESSELALWGMLCSVVCFLEEHFNSILTQGPKTGSPPNCWDNEYRGPWRFETIQSHPSFCRRKSKAETGVWSQGKEDEQNVIPGSKEKNIPAGGIWRKGTVDSLPCFSQAFLQCAQVSNLPGLAGLALYWVSHLLFPLPHSLVIAHSLTWSFWLTFFWGWKQRKHNFLQRHTVSQLKEGQVAFSKYQRNSFTSNDHTAQHTDTYLNVKGKQEWVNTGQDEI